MVDNMAHVLVVVGQIFIAPATRSTVVSAQFSYPVAMVPFNWGMR